MSMQTKSANLSAAAGFHRAAWLDYGFYSVLAFVVLAQSCHVVWSSLCMVPFSQIRNVYFAFFTSAWLRGGIHIVPWQRLFFVEKLRLFAVLLGRLAFKARQGMEPRGRHSRAIPCNCGIIFCSLAESILLSGRSVWGYYVWI